LPPFKAKTLPSPYYFTNAKYHKNQCAPLRATGNSYDSCLFPIHQQPANYLNEEWSIRSLASSAQNHTGYIQNFVMSQYCKFHPHHKSLKPPHPSESDIIYGWSIKLICPSQK